MTEEQNCFQNIAIGGVEIGSGKTPFIIAEMSGNHNQSLDRALAIVDAAAKAGAHAVKLQTYTADTMTLDTDAEGFFIDNPDSLWVGESLYSLYEKAHTPWEWHQPIFERAKQHGMLAFSSPFDESAVDFLEQLDAPCYKIASFENTDVRLIRKVAQTGKPVIISTGMAALSDLQLAVETAREAGCKQLILLKCTSTYPAEASNTNLATIPHLQAMFDCVVGLSDHTKGIGAAVASVALGAQVIEKHFTLSRADGGVDSEFSLEPDELQALVEETRRASLAIGKVTYGASSQEKGSMQFRRSIYLSKDAKAGELLSESNLRIIRPGFGLEPKHYDRLLGMKLKRDAALGTPLSWDLVDG